MENNYFENIKIELKDRPDKIVILGHCLFIAPSTARSIIDNSNKPQFDYLNKSVNCKTTDEVQHFFDTIHVEFRNHNFSQRGNSNYQYLCSLVANFPGTKLTETNYESINTCYMKYKQEL